MSGAPSASILDLPLHILRSIAEQLDRRSAFNLGLTCRQLQLPAESKLWQSINLSRLRNDAKGEPVMANLGSTVMQTLDLLDAHPWRAGMVRSIDMSIRHAVPPELLYLLLKISGGLKQLKAGMLSWATPSLAPTYVPLKDVFLSLPVPLSSLQKADLNVDTLAADTIVALLSKAPCIRQLTIRSRAPPDSATLTLEGTTCLEELTIINPDSLSTFYARLIEQSPLLNTVRLVDTTFYWHPAQGDPLLEALSNLPHLCTVQLPYRALDVFPRQGFESVETMSVMWGNFALAQARVIDQIVPPLPKLKAYLVDLSEHANLNPRISPAYSRPAIDPLKLLNLMTPASLDRTPELAVVAFAPASVWSTNRGLVSESRPWRDCDVNDVAVYSFSRGPALKDELVHLRTHVSGSYRLPCRERACSACRLGWEEKAWWNGQPLPVKVLNATYAAAGSDICALDPGRVLELPGVSWDILRFWRENRDVDQ